MNNWDAWSVGEEVDWKTLEHITFDTEEAAQAYVKELQRLDRKNGIKHRYAINEKQEIRHGTERYEQCKNKTER